MSTQYSLNTGGTAYGTLAVTPGQRVEVQMVTATNAELLVSGSMDNGTTWTTLANKSALYTNQNFTVDVLGNSLVKVTLTGLNGTATTATVNVNPFGSAANAATLPIPHMPIDRSNLKAYWDAGKMALQTYNASDATSSTPATADGTAVGRIIDLTGNGNDLAQATAGSRPTLKTGANGMKGPGATGSGASVLQSFSNTVYMDALVNPLVGAESTGFTIHITKNQGSTASLLVLLGVSDTKFYIAQNAWVVYCSLAGQSYTWDLSNVQVHDNSAIWTFVYDPNTGTYGTVTFYINGCKIAAKTMTTTKPSSFTGTFRVGNLGSSATFAWPGQWKNTLVYTAVHTDAQVAQEAAMLAAEFPDNAYQAPQGYDNGLITIFGNSIALGYATPNAGSGDQANLAAFLAAFLPYTTIENRAISGQTITQEQNSALDQSKVLGRPWKRRLFNIAYVYEGTNEMRTGGNNSSGAATNTLFTTWAGQMSAIGYSPWTSTVMPWISDPNETARAAFNAAIVTNSSFSRVLSYDTTVGSPTGSVTTYWADNYHPRIAGTIKALGWPLLDAIVGTYGVVK